VRSISLIGPRGFVAERVAAFADAGVTTLLAMPASTDRDESVRYVDELRQLLPT
ncbi:MAG: LLM class F420-dependent oxidoreductase, partial [Mycobacterium sp.]